MTKNYQQILNRSRGQNFDKETRAVFKMMTAYLFAKGLSNRAISRKIGIDEYTVRTYLKPLKGSKDFMDWLEQ